MFTRSEVLHHFCGFYKIEVDDLLVCVLVNSFLICCNPMTVLHEHCLIF